MAKKEISLVIRARNALGVGLAKAKASLQKFGAGAARIGKLFVKSFLVAGAALVAFSTKMITGFAAQEKAERAVVASLNAQGEAGEKLLPTIKKMAAAIQDETGIADENTLQIAANMRMLGVQTKQLERASKGVIALTRAGLGNETAQKAMAAALQGNFEQLTRYLPALRTTNDEAEKAAIVNDFLKKGYEAQKQELDTVTGRWNALKGRIGDAIEQIGAAIAGNTQLTSTLDKAGEKIKAFSARVAAFAAAGGFQKFHATARFVLEDTIARVKWFADTVTTVFRNAGSVITNIWQNTIDSVGHFFAKIQAKITGKPFNIPAPEMRDVLAGVEELPQKGGEAYERYQAKLAEIDRQIVASAKKADQERVDSATEAAGDIITTDEQLLAKRKQLQAALKRLANEEKNAVKKAAQEKVKALQDEIKEKEELAKKTVKAFLAEMNAEKERRAALEADAKKADKLRAKQARGIKLSKRDQRFLEEFGKIEAAQQAIKQGQPGNLANQLAKAQAQLKELQGQGKTLEKIRKELASTNKELAKLLRMA